MAAAPTLETLNAEVQNHSKKFEEITDSLAGMGRRQDAQFTALSEKIDMQRAAAVLEERRASEQQLLLLSNNKPDYKGLSGVAATIVGVMISGAVVVGSMALTPLREKIADVAADKHEQQILQQNRNLALEQATNAVGSTVTETRLSLARIEGIVSEQHEEYLRDQSRHVAREDSIDAQLIRRPEIDALLAGVSATVERLSTRMTDIQREYGSNFTLGDAVKELQGRINALQLQANGPLTPPPAKGGG